MTPRSGDARVSRETDPGVADPRRPGRGGARGGNGEQARPGLEAVGKRCSGVARSAAEGAVSSARPWGPAGCRTSTPSGDGDGDGALCPWSSTTDLHEAAATALTAARSRAGARRPCKGRGAAPGPRTPGRRPPDARRTVAGDQDDRERAVSPRPVRPLLIAQPGQALSGRRSAAPSSSLTACRATTCRCRRLHPGRHNGAHVPAGRPRGPGTQRDSGPARARGGVQRPASAGRAPCGPPRRPASTTAMWSAGRSGAFGHASPIQRMLRGARAEAAGTSRPPESAPLGEGVLVAGQSRRTAFHVKHAEGGAGQARQQSLPPGHVPSRPDGA